VTRASAAGSCCARCSSAAPSGTRCCWTRPALPPGHRPNPSAAGSASAGNLRRLARARVVRTTLCPQPLSPIRAAS
jgi:hypothetical protein